MKKKVHGFTISATLAKVLLRSKSRLFSSPTLNRAGKTISSNSFLSAPPRVVVTLGRTTGLSPLELTMAKTVVGERVAKRCSNPSLSDA